MQDTFLYELEQLKETADNMKTALDSLQKVKDAVDTLKGETSFEWIGDAQQAFCKNCTTLDKMLEKEIETIGESQQILEESITKYRQTEAETLNDVKDLSASNIF